MPDEAANETGEGRPPVDPTIESITNHIKTKVQKALDGVGIGAVWEGLKQLTAAVQKTVSVLGETRSLVRALNDDLARLRLRVKELEEVNGPGLFIRNPMGRMEMAGSIPADNTSSVAAGGGPPIEAKPTEAPADPGAAE
jgi:hypothetical protein